MHSTTKTHSSGVPVEVSVSNGLPGLPPPGTDTKAVKGTIRITEEDGVLVLTASDLLGLVIEPVTGNQVRIKFRSPQGTYRPPTPEEQYEALATYRPTDEKHWAANE